MFVFVLKNLGVYLVIRKVIKGIWVSEFLGFLKFFWFIRN